MIKTIHIALAIIGGAGALVSLCAAAPPYMLVDGKGYNKRASIIQYGQTLQTDASDHGRGNGNAVFHKGNRNAYRLANLSTTAEDGGSTPIDDEHTALKHCNPDQRYTPEKTLDSAHCLNLHGLAALKAGKFDEAQKALERALEIRRQILGVRHPDVAVSLNNLAELYRVQGRVNDAQPLFEHALAIREETLGKDHPDVAQSLNNLALIYEQLGKTKLAETLYQRARGIVETGLGQDHPDLANILNNLAGLYYLEKRYAEAEPLFKRAQAIWENHQDFTNLAASLNNLAQLYRATDRYREAEYLCQTTLAIWTQALGPNHPNVATAMETYAELLEDMKRHDEAQRLRAQAQSIRQGLPMDLGE